MINPKKIIAVIVLLSLAVGFVFPIHQTYASAIPYWVKEYIIKPLVRTLANALENVIVNKMTAQISGKTQGQPSFITNWRNQILDSEARGNDVFRSVLADAQLCPYFKTNLQTAFGADKYAGTILGSTIKNSTGQLVYQNKTSVPGLPSFQNLANCTLPANLNINVFKTDFAKGGGWDTWNQLIQPQNNFLGAYTLALNEQTTQRAVDTQSSQNQAIAGQGYLGQKLGTSGTSPNGCVGSLSGTNRCLFLGKEVTPAKLIESVNASSFGTKISRAGFGTELPDVIQGLIGAVSAGLLNGIANQLGQTNYNALVGGTGSLFDESQSNAQQPQSNPNVPSNLQGSGDDCRQLCSNNYNTCNSANNPELNPSASGENLSVCSDELSNCNASCPP